VPVIAVTPVLLPLTAGVLVLVVLVVGFSVTFWRSTSNLQEHVRAGAEMVLEALSRQRQTDASHPSTSALPALAEILPGMGPLVSRTLSPGSSAVGKTLAELHLRALSGASVLAIERSAGGVVAPSGEERLQAGDILSLTGSEGAIERADRILSEGDDSMPEELADVPG
jgi:CPA2 family monovalent cation:H+ antiporter-2